MFETGHASQLFVLEPDLPLTPVSKRMRLSARYQGSMLQNLRKPARLPDVHRPYSPGDPVNRIDWRAYARTDEILLREVQEEAAAKILIVIDAAESMFWPTQEVTSKLARDVISKWELAIRIACHLAFAHSRISDFVTLSIFQDGEYRRIPIRNQSDVLSFFYEFKEAGFSKKAFQELFTRSEMFDPIFEQFDERIFLSDLLHQHSKSAVPLIHASLMFHCLSSLELNDDWFKDDTNYFDSERGPIEFPGKFLMQRKHYLNTIEQWRQTLDQSVRQGGGFYYCLNDQSRISDLHNVLHNAQLGY